MSYTRDPFDTDFGPEDVGLAWQVDRLKYLIALIKTTAEYAKVVGGEKHLQLGIDEILRIIEDAKNIEGQDWDWGNPR